MIDINALSPEESFMLGIKTAMQMTADQGRHGDSRLAHVNPQEERMLMAQGGAGTVNPRTGLPEYFRPDESGRGARGTGNQGRDRGNRDGVGSRSAAERAGQQRAFEQSRAESQRQGAGTSAVSPNPSPGPVDPTGPTGDAGDAGGAATDDRSLGERFADGIEAALRGPALGPPTGDDPGLLGVAASLVAPGVGPLMGAVRGLQAMGFESTADFGDPDADQRDGSQPRDTAILSPRPAPSTPRFPWSRPATAPTAPAALGFDPAMTALQQRAAVATGGTNADASLFRDPQITEFYKNLALYDLLGPNNQPAAGAQVLPIERQFLSQVTGAQPGNTTEDFLTALAGL